ncbi:MAG: 4Fe-4S binding protein [Chitinispirillia bacterium]|jgi:electron transport complex protein RnfB
MKKKSEYLRKKNKPDSLSPLKPDEKRRELLRSIGRVFSLTLMGMGLGYMTKRSHSKTVWQLDPAACVQCGRCATECVLNPSAVKCVHAFDICGYCKLCGGYHRPDAIELNTAAENQLCPAGAIKRKFIEDPFYEYQIDESLCIGCGKCVRGCGSFGNGSLYLQVRHNLCMDCNDCSIARNCPSSAFKRITYKQSYIKKKGAEDS